MQVLTFAYWANIVILVPIAVPTIFRIFPTDEGRMDESQGWRVLVGSLWTAILVLSVLGLFAPERYAPVLLLQLVYKSIWLLVYAAPRTHTASRVCVHSMGHYRLFHRDRRGLAVHHPVSALLAELR